MTDDLGNGDKVTTAAAAEAEAVAVAEADVDAKAEAKSKARLRANAKARELRLYKKAEAAAAAVPDSRPFYLVGGVLSALAIATLLWLYLIALGGAPLTKLLPVIKNDFGYASVPGVLLLLAGVALFFAEMFRRGRLSERERTFFQGGSVGLQLTDTPLRFALVWMLVPAVMYLALVLPARLGETTDSAWGHTLRGASQDFWDLIATYSFVAAGVLGTMLASLLKRATYRALARRGRVREGGNTFWRLVATQWRLETWFAFTATGLLGALPFLWNDALAGDKPFDGSALAIMGGISAASAVIAAVIVLNAWRSGDPYGFGESVA